MKKISVHSLLPDSRDISRLADESMILGVKTVYKAIELIRDKVRDENESRPKHSPENLLDDYVFMAGAVWALNWILSLPNEARIYVNNLE